MIGRMLNIPVTDILVCDFGMMGQASCTVGLMCKSKCLQSSTALQTIPTKILYFHSTIFIDHLIDTLQNLGFIKYVPTVHTTTYIGTVTKQCNWLQE